MASASVSASSSSPTTFLGVSLSSPFDYAAARDYTATTQAPAIWCTAAYVVTIFGIQWFMRNREPVKLVTSLRLWNLWLAVFSILGAAVSGYALLREISTYGLVSSYTHCRDFFEGTTGLWTWWFCMSKFAELGDTYFIVLRKRPLMFLHWYHHVATLNYGLMSYVGETAFNTWIVWLNFTVHAVMYSYYFLAACRIRLPAWFAQCLTTAQITQFLITLAILAHVGARMVAGSHVDSSVTVYVYCLLMEISYVVLFGNFFYHSYIAGGGKKFNKEKQQMANGGSGKAEQLQMNGGSAAARKNE